jgi:hypothetical protein
MMRRLLGGFSRTIFAGISIWASVGFLAACSVKTDPPAEPTGGLAYTSYVGEVATPGVRVGVATEGERLALFFCGDVARAQSHTRWFNLQFDKDFTFASSADGWSVEGRKTANRVSGTLDVGDGQRVAWSAAVRPAESADGLYESLEGGGRAGIIIDQNAVSQGVFIRGAREEFMQITPLQPISRQLTGIRVKFSQGGIERIVSALPARP